MAVVELGLQHQRAGEVPAPDRWRARPRPRRTSGPRRSSSRRAKTEGESNRGKQSQSTEPDRCTSAADRQSDRRAYSAMGERLIGVPAEWVRATTPWRQPDYSRPPGFLPEADRGLTRLVKVVTFLSWPASA